MKVDIYTKLEKDFEKFSNDDEIKAFVKNLEDEKAKFKELETELTNKTKDVEPKTTAGVDTTKEKPADTEDVKNPEDVKKEADFLDSAEKPADEKPAAEPAKVEPKAEPKVGDKFNYTNKKNETHKVIVVGVAQNPNDIQIQYLDKNDKPILPKIAVLKTKLVPIETK